MSDQTTAATELRKFLGYFDQYQENGFYTKEEAGVKSLLRDNPFLNEDWNVLADNIEAVLAEASA